MPENSPRNTFPAIDAARLTGVSIATTLLVRLTAFLRGGRLHRCHCGHRGHGRGRGGTGPGGRGRGRQSGGVFQTGRPVQGLHIVDAYRAGPILTQLRI